MGPRGVRCPGFKSVFTAQRSDWMFSPPFVDGCRPSSCSVQPALPLTLVFLSLPAFPALLLVLSPRSRRTAALLCCSRYLCARPGLVSRPCMLPSRPELPPRAVHGMSCGPAREGQAQPEGEVVDLSVRFRSGTGATWQVPRGPTRHSLQLPPACAL